MRTSRGLQITSIIVALPVLLILSSLVLILALAIQTQLKSWAIQHQPTILTSRPISKLASTALILSPKPITRRLRLKRFLPSTVWSWLGVLTVFALITVQKLDLVSCSQKAYAFITPPPTEPATDDCGSNDSGNVPSSAHNTPSTGTPEDTAASALKSPRRKKVRTKHRSSNTGAAQKITLQPPNSTPPSTAKQEQCRQRQQKQQQQPLLGDVRAQSDITTSVPEDTIVCCGISSSNSSSSSEEEDASEWISVGERKKKKTKRDYTDYYHPQQQQDDELPKAPVAQEQAHQPVIRNWYSPFSTGLDLDIMPPRSKQDDQQNWRMDPFYQHAPFFQEQPFSFFDHTMSV